mgnify:CR=1 FL=1
MSTYCFQPNLRDPYILKNVSTSFVGEFLFWIMDFIKTSLMSKANIQRLLMVVTKQ